MAAKGECTSEIGAFTLDGKGLVSGRVSPCHLEVCLRYWDNTQLGQFRARSQAINDPDREPITNKLGTSGNSQGMGSLVFFSFFWMSWNCHISFHRIRSVPLPSHLMVKGFARDALTSSRIVSVENTSAIGSEISQIFVVNKFPGPSALNTGFFNANIPKHGNRSQVGSQLQYRGHLGVKNFDSKRSRWTKTELQWWGWCTDKAARLVTVCSRAASRTNNEWPVSHPYWRCWRRNGSLLFILRQHYHLRRRQTQRHHHCLYVWTSPPQLLYHVQLPVVATGLRRPVNFLRTSYSS